MVVRNIAALGIGCALDALLGDPHDAPHPVRLIGKQIDFEEGLIRSYVYPAIDEGAFGTMDRNLVERLMGAALTFDVVLAAPLAAWGVVRICERIHPLVGLAAEGVICYYMIAARSLRDESMKVHAALAAGDLEGARKAVSMIVGRDTACLDEAGVARAAVETVAENTSDGVVAPLLYGAFYGAPGMAAYKAVNTLDSMIGYKNEKYANLGFVAAKLDDAVNYIPARISGALMCVAAGLVGLDADEAWRIFLRDRLNHSSPNSAHTEAACAGALGVQLGGGNYYFGEYVEKPTIGDDARPVEADDIVKANKLMFATAALGLACAAVLGFASGFLFGGKGGRA